MPQLLPSAAPFFRAITALVLALVIMPAMASAQDEADSVADQDSPRGYAEEYIDPFADDDGFDFSQLRDIDRESGNLPPNQDPETSEVLPARRAVPRDDDDGDASPPEEPLVLRFRFDEPMRFDVNTNSRMGFEDRPGLRQIYQSGLAVEYRPITAAQRDQMLAWPIDVALADDAPQDEDAPIIAASIFRFSGAFDQPRGLSDSARTHQILKDALFSYQVSARGQVFNVQIHPPTNPLARSSLEEMVRLLAASHPVLPEEAVSPGDSWSATIATENEDDRVLRAQDAELEYTFDGWARCGATYCARIDVEQTLQAAGRYTMGNRQTRGASSGSGSGWFLLDPERGRIVRSHWEIDNQGTSTIVERNRDSVEEVLQIQYNLSVETTVRLIERSSQQYDLVPLD